MRVPDKIKEVAKEDFEQAKELATDAVRSGAYLYPFKVRVSNLPSQIHPGGHVIPSLCGALNKQHKSLRDLGSQCNRTNTASRESPTSSRTVHYGNLSPRSSSRLCP